MKVKAKKLTEEQVLKKLDIPNFRYVSKDKIMSFFSTIPDMDPEVAKKAIEQFPEYSGVVKDVLKDYKGLIEKTLTDNQNGMDSYYSSCDAIISSINKELDRDDISFEEKKYYIDQMLELESRLNKKDTEDKKFKTTIITIATTAIITAVCGLAAVLGANSNKK